jgi:hypothetical protein
LRSRQPDRRARAKMNCKILAQEQNFARPF